MPGRPSSSIVAEASVHQRLSGPQGHAPEAEIHALAAQGLLHEVVLADRGAAEGDEDVGARIPRRLDALVEGFERVPGNAEIDGLGAGLLGHQQRWREGSRP